MADIDPVLFGKMVQGITDIREDTIEIKKYLRKQNGRIEKVEERTDDLESSHDKMKGAGKLFGILGVVITLAAVVWRAFL